MVQDIQNDPALQPSTKHQYIKALENYLATGGSLADPQALTEYAPIVGNSARSFLVAVVTRMAQGCPLCPDQDYRSLLDFAGIYLLKGYGKTPNIRSLYPRRSRNDLQINWIGGLVSNHAPSTTVSTHTLADLGW